MGEVNLVDHMQKQIFELRKAVKMLKQMTVPKKGVVMFTECGRIPKGYRLCDGTKGTPDLRDRFVMDLDEACDSDTCEAEGKEVVPRPSIYSLCYIMRI